MNREIKPQDTPKIALALGLLLALGGAGLSASRNAAAQAEEQRMALQMKRESGARVEASDELLSPAQADEAQTQREDADPNFRS